MIALFERHRNSNKHLDASQILRKQPGVDASLERAAVYCTLVLLKRHGLIDELDLLHVNNESHYYERRLGANHIHLAGLRAVATLRSS